ncbi:unannotated protein [freshwater metagenome]|uniref:Unannotated protein n=1 Tax=freshwater metagenome TaxID=449393 RepID=A0A6J6DMM3_9ZZZZ|nr:hypothetical protein [Actinomycetota bacterium]MTA93876.1 hypothetical protein [Actinomycetota bacterium]
MTSHVLAKLLIPALLLSPALSSCSQDNNNDNSSTTTTSVLFGDANPSRVLLAAVILASGDIEKALAEGLVTSLDVDAAVAAIKNGTLDAWRQRAEAEFGK